MSAIQPIKEEPAGILTEPLTSEGEALRRKFCNLAARWRDCREPACRRAHSCRGDAADCFARCWNASSQLGRVWIEFGFTALEEGRSTRAAARDADAALLRHVKLTERLSLLPPTPRRRPV